MLTKYLQSSSVARLFSWARLPCKGSYIPYIRGMRQRFLITLITTVLCFAGRPAAHAGPAEQPPASPQPLSRLSDLVIPSDLGQLSQVSEDPAAGPAAKRLILIEDAHANYEGQKHLAGILDQLASRQGIRLILVEGGEGDLSLPGLRDGVNSVMPWLADAYLRDGKLSGEEYLYVTSSYPLTIWGVDDPALYEQQFAAFQETEPVREELGKSLAEIQAVIQQLKDQTPNEPLKRFQARTAAFAAGTIQFNEYAKELENFAQEAGFSFAPYPHLEALLNASRVEADLDREQVSREQREALGRIKAGVSSQIWEGLSAVAAQLKAGAVPPDAYYSRLDALLEEAGAGAGEFPELRRYLEYMALRAKSSGQAWWDELAAVQKELRERLIRTPDERRLIELADDAAICSRLLALQWDASDRDKANQRPETLRSTAWLPALHTYAARANIALPAVDGAALDQALGSSRRFYDIAERRDAELVRRALEKLDATGERTAVLIAGGFHTGRLVDRLTGHGVAVAVVTPWAGEGGGTSRYAELLKAKHDHRSR